MIGLPTDTTSIKSSLLQRKSQVLAAGFGGLLLVILCSTNLFGYLKILFTSTHNPSLCPVYDKIAPSSYHFDNSTVLSILHDESFRLQSVKKLSGAVQVDTQVGDDQPDVPDAPELWAKFKNFHTYLEKTFPTVYDTVDVATVNTYGLVLSWPGSDPSLKPVLLTAHQDVVPVQNQTLGDWTYPPFEGHYDGTYLYGRGASDCKNVLVAIMEALELLVAKNYKPKRGIVAAFGFDEEASGTRGAAHIGKYLEKTFGKDSFYSLLDEGPGVQLDASIQQIVAVPATGEKGYVDIEVNLKTPGGHSSVPPDHTSIGIASELAYIIEKDQYPSSLTTKNPILNYLQCLAVNSDKLPSLTKKVILRAGFDKLANSKIVLFLRNNPLTKYLITTSQAIDIIDGGEKANALPEHVKVVVNHRVNIETTIQELQDHFVSRVLTLAEKYDLLLEAFGETIYEPTVPGKGSFVVDVLGHEGLEAAPVTPANDTVWKYLAGTTRHVFEDLVFTNLTYPVIMAPSIMPANTDTRHYWNLTKNIFRYSPFFSVDIIKDSHIHSVDERVRFDGHLELLTFFYEYIQNVDTAAADN